jgi:hypothetical protein
LDGDGQNPGGYQRLENPGLIKSISFRIEISAQRAIPMKKWLRGKFQPELKKFEINFVYSSTEKTISLNICRGRLAFFERNTSILLGKR